MPHDWIDKVAFHLPTSIDEITPPPHLANPIALGLHIVLYLLIAPIFARRDEPDSILRGAHEAKRAGSRWDHLDEEGWGHRITGHRSFVSSQFEAQHI